MGRSDHGGPLGYGRAGLAGLSRRLSAALASRRLRNLLVGAPMGLGALGIGFLAQGLVPGSSGGLSGPMLDAVLEAPPQHSTPRVNARDDLQGVQAQRAARGGATLAEPERGTPLNLEIRVAVERQAGRVELGATGPWWLRRRDGSVIERGAAGQPFTVSLGDALPAEVWIETSAGESVLLNGRAYAGRLRVLAEGGGLLVVNHLPLEQYVASVVGAEMPSSWDLEALKAQAVAARSYALAHMARPASAHWHLGDTTRWQAYRGLASSTTRTRRAADETAGLILSYQGGIVESLYAANSQISAEAHGHLGASMSQEGAQALASGGQRYN
ncbi:MAG: SpoIID/LytB domain-containing protein, partial [Cyanobium sp.]